MEAFNTWCKKNSVREYKKLKDFREKITGVGGHLQEVIK